MRPRRGDHRLDVGVLRSPPELAPDAFARGDEAHGIAKTLESVAPFIDRWTIMDTGSTDGTQEIIKAALAARPGDLIEGPFDDFSSARNRVLDAHGGKTDWTLIKPLDSATEVK